MSLFISKEYILISKDNSHKVNVFSMMFVAFINNRIVEMMICCNFITWSHTVTRYNCSIHNLCWIHECRNNLFCIYTIIICVMQKSL